MYNDLIPTEKTAREQFCELLGVQGLNFSQIPELLKLRRSDCDMKTFSTKSFYIVCRPVESLVVVYKKVGEYILWDREVDICSNLQKWFIDYSRDQQLSNYTALY